MSRILPSPPSGLIVLGICLGYAGWIAFEPSVDGIIAGALISVFLSFRYLHRKGQTLSDSQKDSLVINIGLGLALVMVLVIDKHNVSFLGEGADGESGLVLGGVLLAGVFAPALFRKRRLIPSRSDQDLIRICIGLVRIALIGIDVFLLFVLVLGVVIDLTAMGFPIRYFEPAASGALLGTVVACGGALIASRLIRRFEPNIFRFPSGKLIILEFIGLGLCLPLLGSILFTSAYIKVFGDLEVYEVVTGLLCAGLLTVFFLVLYLYKRRDHNFLFLKSTYKKYWGENDLSYFKWLSSGAVRLGHFLIGSIIVFTYFLFAFSFAYDFGPSTFYGYLAAAGVYRVSPEKFIHVALRDTYLWYDNVPRFHRTGTSSPDQVLEELMYHKMDKWSHLADSEKEYELGTEGRYKGLGLKLKKDEEGNLYTSLVYEDSPAGRAGIRRGLKVLAVGGYRVEENMEDALSACFPEDEHKRPVKFVFEDQDGHVRKEELMRDVVNLKTACYHRCFDLSDMKVGYLFFDSFLETSITELYKVFAEFKKEGINELVLDLRYNGGGDLDVALYLASLISGAATEGKVFAKLLHSAKYSDLNDAVHFGIHPLEMSSGEQYLLEPYALDLKRLVVITTGATASASEVLLNGLKPFTEVILVGSATCGKLVGSQPIEFDDSLISLINFRTINAEGKGNYIRGFQPTCPAEDDLTRPLGDVEEASLKEALHYLECGECSRKEKKKEGTARKAASAIPVEAVR